MRNVLIITRNPDIQPLKLERIDSPNGRRYITPDGQALPSVTTILSATADMSGLEAWRQRVGDKRADEELRVAIAHGTLIHKILEDTLSNIEYEKKGNMIHVNAKRMADKIIDKAFPRISEIYGIELPLYYPSLYAGTADLVAILDGKLTIIDYKNSKKIKKEEYIEDYFIQTASYAQAFNYVYGTNINRAAIFMVTRPATSTTAPEYGEFIIEGEEFEKYARKWNDRLAAYYAEHS